MKLIDDVMTKNYGLTNTQVGTVVQFYVFGEPSRYLIESQTFAKLPWYKL